MSGEDRPCVLVIAASDSSGGAGIARDLLTLGELGLDAAVALTAVTVQTDAGVAEIVPLDPGLVGAEIEAALSARPVAAIKIGLLANARIIETVAGVLTRHDTIPVVLDPVIASSSGTVFLDRAALDALTKRLSPLSTLVTPNLPELAALTGEPEAGTEPGAIAQARRLNESGARAVLVKGGHAAGGEAADILVSTDGPPVRMAAPRLARGARGTGCMLSSAIAAHLARGTALEAACRAAKAHVWSHIASAA